MKKWPFTILVFLAFNTQFKCQVLDVFNDSSSYKKEIFKTIFSYRTNDKDTKVHKFRDYVGTFGIMQYKDDKEVQAKLKKHLPKGTIKEIFNLHRLDYPYTTWSEVFSGELIDNTIGFVKERHVDDFFYNKDSLQSQGKDLDKFNDLGLLDLWTIEPFLFSVEINHEKKTYSIVGFYSYQSLENIYGRKGKIYLMELKAGKWSVIESLVGWLY